MNSRKAQASQQFNWIFILVVGGLILSLFVAFSSRQQAIAEVQIDAKSLEAITTIFESARTGTSLSTTINTPYIEMDFNCEVMGDEFGNYIYSDYSVNGIRKKTEGMVIFAPQKLEGKGLITWTYPWDFPFRVMNFFFVANERTRYYFLLKDSKYNDLFNLIQEGFSDNIKSTFVDEVGYDISSGELIKDLNDDLTVIVIISDAISDPNYLTKMENLAKSFSKDVEFVVLSPVSEYVPPRANDGIFGDVAFFDKKGISKQSSFMGLASIYGAIVSSDKDYYECTMQKASERFKRLSCIFLQKYESLKEEYTPECKAIYLKSIQDLRTYFTGSSTGNFCAFDSSKLVLSSEKLISIMDENDGLSKYENELLLYKKFYDSNRGAIRESCAPLY